MGIDGEAYAGQLRALLPPGNAWTAYSDSTLLALLKGLAVELARVDARGGDVVAESLPSETLELFTQWESVLGLPDACTGTLPTLQQRRGAIISKLTTLGSQSRAFYIALAAAIGVPITITEFRPFQAGQNRAGEPVLSSDWIYWFQVNAAAFSQTYFRAGISAAGEPLAAFGNSQLECLLNRAKPAHTQIIFAYS